MSKHPINDALLEGQIIREPVGDEQGYWAGAPGWFWDETDQAAYVCYRIRRPRGVEPDRGGESRIAKTTDFQNFEDVWSVHKDAYQSASIEKSILQRGNDGKVRYYTSYVAPEDGRWCTTINTADTVESLDRRIQFVELHHGIPDDTMIGSIEILSVDDVLHIHQRLTA